MNASIEHAIWLLPRADQQAALQQLVRELAPRHEGHLFEPHVTLQGDLPLARGPASELVDRLAGSTSALQWPVQAVEGTEHYFRALYLRLTAGPAFDALCEQCVDASSYREGLSPYAHMSLAYGPTRGDVTGLRSELARAWAGQTLVLDRVALCRSGQAVPIEAWELLHVRPLAGAAV